MNILVGETHNKPVLGGVILALILGDQTTTGLVVSLSLATAAPLGLVTLRIGLILRELDARHCLMEIRNSELLRMVEG